MKIKSQPANGGQSLTGDESMLGSIDTIRRAIWARGTTGITAVALLGISSSISPTRFSHGVGATRWCVTVSRARSPEFGADLSRDLGLHQLTGDQHDRLPDEILKPPIADLRNDIVSL